jgi:deoxyhypusine synthase
MKRKTTGRTGRLDYRSIRKFIDSHFSHFNAYALKMASQAYIQHLRKGNRMLVAMAGAMSTAEIGGILAGMIRRDKVHAICTTGANLEEDIFNLIAHDHYEHIPHYRQLAPGDEENLYKRGLNRVTDTCIPEAEAMLRVQGPFLERIRRAEQKGQRFFPFEFFYQMIRGGDLKSYYQIDPGNSWVIAACRKNIPIWTPGWEDSTLGNYIVAASRKKMISSHGAVKSGLEQMNFLIDWYLQNTRKGTVGFFQIGGGIAGDFAICVVPLITQDLKEKCKYWGYFCQISDSTTSYGSYSGASPNEKITWGKLAAATPKFHIESDATIVAPLMFAYVLAAG